MGRDKSLSADTGAANEMLAAVFGHAIRLARFAAESGGGSGGDGGLTDDLLPADGATSSTDEVPGSLHGQVEALMQARETFLSRMFSIFP